MSKRRTKRQCNTCVVCGACNGRCGRLTYGLCQNCYDTRVRREVVTHERLERTSEELAKTMAILEADNG